MEILVVIAFLTFIGTIMYCAIDAVRSVDKSFPPKSK